MELNKSEQRLLRRAEKENRPGYRRICFLLRMVIAVFAVSVLWGSFSAHKAALDQAKIIDDELGARAGASPASSTAENTPGPNRQDRAHSACMEMSGSGMGFFMGALLLCCIAVGSRERNHQRLLLRFGRRLVQVGELGEEQVFPSEQGSP